MPQTVDRGYAWVVMMANFGSFIVASGMLMTSGITITTLQERFQENVAKTALVGSLYTALSSLAAPIGTCIIVRTSCRIAVITGSILMTLGFLATAFSDNLNLCIFFCGIVAGLGSGICYSVLFIVNGFYFKERLNFATGISTAGGGVGIFLMPPLLEKAKEIYGYPGLFVLAAGSSLQLLFFGVLMRPSFLEMQTKCKDDAQDNPLKRDETDFQIYIKLLRDRATVILTLSFACFSGGIYTAYMFWPSLCQENGFSAMQASYFMSISGITAIAGRIVVGTIASKFKVNIFYMYCISLIALGIPCVAFNMYAATTVGQIINAIVLGTFCGAPLVIFASVTIECVGVKYLPAAGGLQLLFGGVASIVMPVICGCIVNAGRTYGDAFIICGACLLVGAVLSLVTKFTTKKLYLESETIQTDQKLSLITKQTERIHNVL